MGSTENMKNAEIIYFPSWAKTYLQRIVNHINTQLAALQDCVEAHGETWADVEKYVERGADYHIAERLAECRAHLDKLDTPAYLRADAEQRAVDDLGAENVQYWKELAQLLVIRESPTDTQALPLLDIADVSGERWQLKQDWIYQKRDGLLVHVPQWLVADFELLQTANKALAQLHKSGYDISEFYMWSERGEEIDLDIEWFVNTYTPERDSVHAALGNGFEI